MTELRFSLKSVTHGTEPAFPWLQVIYILIPQNEKVGNYLVTAFLQPGTQRGSCFACRCTTETKLARSHYPASNYSHPFENMPWLPILDFSPRSKQQESKKPLCTSTKEQQIISRATAGRSDAALTSPSAGSWRPGGVLEPGGKMQHGFQSSTRPGLRSWAAPVRFSNGRIAAKSLPMPEEFPEQHSRSFSNCFETTLSVLQ